MHISDLLKEYGDDKVKAQFLDQCADKLNMNKGVTKITFGTDQPIDFNGTQQLGIVIWLDRERVKEIIAASKRIGTMASPTPPGSVTERHPEDDWTEDQHADATSYLTTGKVQS